MEEVWPEVRMALELGVGGFVVFGGDVTRMWQLAERVGDTAREPIVFAADLERGAGQQLGEATPLPPAAALALDRDEGLFEAARITAQEAASAGIGWVLAPVADLDVEPRNPIVGTRSFGSDPRTVADCIRAWITVTQAEGVATCAKHFPGHGRTIADSHVELPSVSASAERLEADLLPFRAAVDADVASIMMAHVAYPSLDPSGVPASLSGPIVGMLREELGFEGVVVTDAMIMAGAVAGARSPETATVAALRAGCDIVLYPESLRDTVTALDAAVRGGALPEDGVSESIARLDQLIDSLDLEGGGPRPLPSYERALELAARSVVPLRGALPEWPLGMRVRLHVVEDDRPAAPLSVAAPGGVEIDRGRLREALLNREIRVVEPDAGGAADDLIAIFSDVRAWKGRASLAPETVSTILERIRSAPEAVLLLFGHPRLAEQLPSAAHIVCAWSGEPLMQEAAAERLRGQRGR